MNLLELPKDMLIIICYDNILTYNTFNILSNYCYKISRSLDPKKVFLGIIIDGVNEYSVLKQTGQLYGTSYQWYPSTEPKEGRSLERMYNMKNSILNGLFRRWYENGMIERECMFKNGKIVGTMKYWYNRREESISINHNKEIDTRYPPDTQGQLRQLCTYIYSDSIDCSQLKDQAGVRHGMSYKYHIDGRLKCISNYVMGRKEGIVHKWNIKGQQSQIPYVDGKKHGIAKLWSENGTVLFTEVQYKNGVRDGIYKEQYHNNKGWISVLGLYKNNMLHGEYVEKYFNGQIYSKCTYINGEIEGERVTYHENGKVWEIRYYLNGRGYGESKIWNEDGILIS